MKFFNQLELATQQGKEYLLTAPIINRCLQGDISLDDYVAFLSQA